jgi:hypothetical protein
MPAPDVSQTIGWATTLLKRTQELANADLPLFASNQVTVIAVTVREALVELRAVLAGRSDRSLESLQGMLTTESLKLDALVHRLSLRPAGEHPR